MTFAYHIRAASFGLLRVPLLAWDEFANPAKVNVTGLEDRESNEREKLRAWLSRPLVMQALSISSKNLVAELGPWLEEPCSPRGRQTERALIRYFARTCGRPMPFGLNASASVIKPGPTLGHLGPIGRRSRIDYGVLFPLARALSKVDPIRRYLRFYWNDSSYVIHGTLRYFERRGDIHRVTSVELDTVVEHVRKLATPGVCLRDCSRSIASTFGVDACEADAYLAELEAAQLLVPELLPSIIGNDSLDAMIALLEELLESAAGSVDDQEVIAAKTQPLRVARHLLREMDADLLGDKPPLANRLAEVLEQIHRIESDVPEVQVDATRPTLETSLFSEISAEAESVFPVMWNLCRIEPNPALRDFAQRFQDRYEESEQRLVEVLDPEFGIPFGTTPPANCELSRDLPVATRSTGARLVARDAFLLTRLSRLVALREDEWEITPDEIELIKQFEPEPGSSHPTSLTATCRVYQQRARPTELRFQLGGVTGPSCARMLGRYLYANAELHELVAQELAYEQSQEPDALFAEVRHLSSDRLANVVQRPELREWQIPCTAESSAPSASRIALEDLTIALRDGRFVIRSVSQDRRVVPRLSNAHNYETSTLPMYRFLAEAQRELACGAAGWVWGRIPLQQYYPAVRIGRTYLTLRNWHIFSDQIRAVLASQEPRSSFLALCARLRIPRFVHLVEQDQELPVDLENPLSLDALLHAAAQKKIAIWLSEVFPSGYEPAIGGDGGRFCGEVVLPLRWDRDMNAALNATPARASGGRANAVARRVLPGRDCLYVKCYGSVIAQERILTDVLPRFVKDSERFLSAWFFVRYRDPEDHLRIRLLGVSDETREPLFRQLIAEIESRVKAIFRVQLDTYEREIERYQAIGDVNAVERLFTADSRAALDILALATGEDALPRWRAILRTWETICTAFGLTPRQSACVLREQRDRYLRENGIASPALLGAKFREMKPELALPMGNAFTAQQLERICTDLSIAMTNVLRESRGAAAQILPSLLHMHANRVLGADSRREEMVICDVLSRLLLTKDALSRGTARSAGGRRSTAQ